MRVVCVVGGAIGMTTLFLTHVRSLSLLAAAGIARMRRSPVPAGTNSRRCRQRCRWLESPSSAGAYLWAVSVGGDAVADRFLGLLNDGVFSTFDENRGLFIRYTLTELLVEFPFGAGLGRWGMMQVLFGDSTMWQAPPIHVEIQPTGWLLDGGVPLCSCMARPSLIALRHTYRLAADSHDRSCFRTLATRSALRSIDRRRALSLGAGVQHPARHSVLGCRRAHWPALRDSTCVKGTRRSASSAGWGSATCTRLVPCSSACG